MTLMVVSAASMLLWRVGFSWVLCVRLGYGAVGVWIAMVLDWIVRDLFYLPRFLTGRWTKHAVAAPAAR